MIAHWERQRAFLIADSSRTAEVRRFATQLAEAAGLSQSETGNVAIISTELATNLVKHTKGGQILVRSLTDGDAGGVELLSLDNGPGIANLGEALRDGYSTAGSPGMGLGAIARLATEFDVFSLAGKGTAVMARLWDHRLRKPATRSIELGAACLAMPGEDQCGDAWSYEVLPDRSIFVLVDGLGHGLGAAEAAQQAIRTVREHRTNTPAEIVQYVHLALRSTQGAAIALAELNLSDQVVRYCGLGNISGSIITAGRVNHLVSYDGTAGYAARKIAEFTYPWSVDSILIMHSDGLMSRWDLQAYPGLLQRHPSIIAGVLYRDFTRGRDDVTVLAAKHSN
jgi:anti-sigma regulatory factor (Ser/Thr protein kinase)